MSLPSIYGDGDDMAELWSLTDPDGYPRDLAQSWAAYERQHIEAGDYREHQDKHDRETGLAPLPSVMERLLRLPKEQQMEICLLMLDWVQSLEDDGKEEESPR